MIIENIKGYNIKALISIITCFFVWSIFFIYRSSMICIDGNRYFCLFDDAMISMRYAWNFSHGHGLVWNIGEYVEGYTNLLMVLLMSIATFFLNKSNAVLAIQIFGIFTVIGISYISLLIIGILSEKVPNNTLNSTSILCLISILFFYPLSYWTLMGMETGLVTFLQLLGILFLFRYLKTKKNIYIVSLMISLGLAYLTRPDALIPSLICISFLLLETLRKKPSFKEFLKILSASSLILIFVIGQEIFRFYYYNELLPNTYTLKVSGWPISHRLTSGFTYVSVIFGSFFHLFLFVGISYGFRIQKEKVLIIIIILANLFYSFWVGGDAFILIRFFIPVTPLVFILYIVALSEFDFFILNKKLSLKFSLLKKLTVNKINLNILTLIIFFISFLYANISVIHKRGFNYKNVLSLSQIQTVDNNLRNINKAIVIKKLTAPTSSVGVFAAGTIPYYTDRYAVDFLGKSDKKIARLSPDLNMAVGHNKYDLNYSIKSLRPTYIGGFRWGGQDLSGWVSLYYSRYVYKGIPVILRNSSKDVLIEKH